MEKDKWEFLELSGNLLHFWGSVKSPTVAQIHYWEMEVQKKKKNKIIVGDVGVISLQSSSC